MAGARQDDRFQSLLDGYAEFRARDYCEQRARYRHLASEGQSPKVMVIACSDSRVDPATVFHAAPGEMFVLRHIAALVPPCERDGKHHSASAAIEYAVTVLGIEHIVVFGHGGCGGIAASLSHCFDHCPEGDGGFIHQWVDTMSPIRDRLLAEHEGNEEALQLALELASIRLSLTNLRSFPHVPELEAAGKLVLHGSHFDIRNGTLRLLDPGSSDFATVEPVAQRWPSAA